MDAVAKAARAAQGASPEALVSLYEELQRNPQLKQLVAAGLLSWSDLLGDKTETLPDGTKARVVDAKKLLIDAGAEGGRQDAKYPGGGRAKSHRARSQSTG